MPRQRLAPGEHGKITEIRRGGTWYATTYVRLHTGKLREREASSAKSAEDARRTLMRRIKTELESTTPAGIIGNRTTLSELFDVWIAAKVAEDGLKEQSESQYRRAWRLHGDEQLGALRIGELTTSRADAHLKSLQAGPSTALRTILAGMFSLAARFDVVRHSPITEARASASEKKAARAITSAELEQVREAVRAYCAPSPARGKRAAGGGRPKGPMLRAFVELLAATGDRPGEVLAIQWPEVDLLGDPPTVTVTGTLLDHGAIPGKPLHRQDSRKKDAPPHTVLLPKFGVEVLTELFGRTVSVDGPVLASSSGGWVSLSSISKQFRAALNPHPELHWVTPHSFRRSVATVVRDGLGIEAAQAQLSHSQLSTTEQHYAQKRTVGPDARAVLDKWAGQPG